MIKGTTASGFDFEIEDDALDDWELLESLYDMDHDNTGEIVGVTRRLLSEEQRSALMKHLRKENGRVKASDVAAAVLEIMSAAGKGKNS